MTAGYGINSVSHVILWISGKRLIGAHKLEEITQVD